MINDLKRVLRRFSYVVLPGDCAVCHTALSDDPVPFFCSACWGTIQPLPSPCCPRCGRPFPSPHTLSFSPGHHCAACRRHRPSYTKAWSLFYYASPLEEAIRLFKYKNKVSLSRPLGNLFHERLGSDVTVDLIMAVPLHASRLFEREYNQSLLLAAHLSRCRGWRLSCNNLVRVRDTPPQSLLKRRLRMKNLHRAFAVRRPDEIIGRRILLVDDVFTTGTTVNECAKALRRAGAGEVLVATLAPTL